MEEPNRNISSSKFQTLQWMNQAETEKHQRTQKKKRTTDKKKCRIEQLLNKSPQNSNKINLQKQKAAAFAVPSHYLRHTNSLRTEI
jgi:lipase chaperone LimK